MKVRRGDIYWITKNPYRPTAGSVQSPGRPGIVVSNDANNDCALTFEIVYLTSKPKKPLPTHCAIASAERPSIALCEQVQTISDEQISDYVGHCTEEEMRQIDRCIAISLGLVAEEASTRKEPQVTPEVEVLDPWEKIHKLEMDLAAANARVSMITQLYNSLLDRTIG